jgi:hypothetical protein
LAVLCATGFVGRDRVEYSLPLGRLGGLAHAAFVRRDLERIFDFRRGGGTARSPCQPFAVAPRA